MLRLLPAVLAALLPAAAIAGGPPDELIEIEAGETPQIRADKAYLLFRIPAQQGPSIEPLLMRVPSAAEIGRFEQAKAAAFQRALPDLTRDYERLLARRARQKESGQEPEGPVPPAPSLDSFAFVWDEVANLQDVYFGDAFVRGESENTYLVEVPPGEYVLYGLSPATKLPQMVVCFCLGTVGVRAEPGRITDLGYIIGDYAKMRSALPELADETGFGPSSDPGPWILAAGTVRPVRENSSLPAALRGTRIEPAAYHAVGRFFTPNAMGINRLVPVPGILAYDGGKVIDVATGQAVPDNF